MRTPLFLLRFLSVCLCLAALTTSALAQQNWRWVNMLPASSGFKSAAYGNGIYVAVGDDSTIVSSPDAVNWTVRRMSTTNSVLNGVAFGNGRFVAVGMGTPTSIGAGLVLTSTDGIAWTANDTVASTINAQFSGVAYGNDLFVISGASQNRVLTSPDGLTWTARNAGYNTGRIAFGGGKFFALANNNSGYVSADGITWTKATIDSSTTAFFEGIVYGNNRFVAVGRGSDFNPLVATSTDGATWTSSGITGSGSGGLSWVAFANNVFAAAGNGGLFSSADGATWTKRTDAMPQTRKSSPGSVGTENFGGAAGANDLLFVFGIYGSITTSTDGATWTRRSTGTANDINGLIHDGTKFVGVGTGGTVVTSVDGTTWTDSSTNLTGWLGQLAYGNGRYVTAGISGGYFSSDLKTWTAIPGTSFNQMFGVIYANDRFIAANNAISLGLPTSSDGSTWTTVKLANATGSVVGLAGGGGSFVIVTSIFGGSPKIYSSTDAATWTETTPAGLTAPDSLAYGNGRYVLVTGTDSWTSPDGVTWTSHAFGFNEQVTDVMYVGSKFVGRGTKGNYSVIYRNSSDGVTWSEIENSTPPNVVVAAMIAKDDKVYAAGGGGSILQGDLAGSATPSAPESQAVAAGGTATLTTAATGAIQWQRNGSAIAGATSGTLALSDIQPASAGIYTAVITDGSTTTTQSAILGVSTSSKVIGTGSEFPGNITHPNGKIYDPLALTGAAATITADAGQATRISFVDLNDDIVQVEFAGAGTLTLILDAATGPAAPAKYNQPSASYMKGHAGIVIAGADETTNVSIFSVGRLTAFDPTGAFDIAKAASATNDPANNGSPLFTGHAASSYDGIADVAFIAIQSTNGKFGGLRAANAGFFAAKGFTGVYAPGVAFTGPLFVHDVNASDAATPVLLVGSVSDARITGGSLKQDNSKAVQVSGLTQLKFTDGTNSHNLALPAQSNQAKLEQDGADVTITIVVNPTPASDGGSTGKELTYFAAGTNPPYAMGAKKSFEVSSTTLKFDSTTLTNPVQATLNNGFTSSTFTDSATGLVWEVSFKDGVLHEINISRNGVFVGQWS